MHKEKMCEIIRKEFKHDREFCLYPYRVHDGLAQICAVAYNRSTHINLTIFDKRYGFQVWVDLETGKINYQPSNDVEECFYISEFTRSLYEHNTEAGMLFIYMLFMKALQACRSSHVIGYKAAYTAAEAAEAAYAAYAAEAAAYAAAEAAEAAYAAYAAAEVAAAAYAAAAKAAAYAAAAEDVYAAEDAYAAEAAAYTAAAKAAAYAYTAYDGYAAYAAEAAEAAAYTTEAYEYMKEAFKSLRRLRLRNIEKI